MFLGYLSSEKLATSAERSPMTRPTHTICECYPSRVKAYAKKSCCAESIVDSHCDLVDSRSRSSRRRNRKTAISSRAKSQKQFAAPGPGHFAANIANYRTGGAYQRTRRSAPGRPAPIADTTANDRRVTTYFVEILLNSFSFSKS
jgi:hypothetical protein